LLRGIPGSNRYRGILLAFDTLSRKFYFCFNSSTYVKSKDLKVKPLVFHGGNRRAFHSLAPRGNRHGRSIGTVFWY